MIGREARGAAPTVEAIVLAALSRLGSDRTALERFLDATGLDVRALRAGMSDGSLQSGILHHVAHDQDLLLAIAADLGLPPDDLAAAIDRSTSPDTALEAGVSAGNAPRASASGRRVRPRV